MISHPDNYEQVLARFRLKRHLAGKGYPSARVTDKRAHWHLRKRDHDSERTPTREAHKLLRHHERVSLIVQALLIWGAVAWMVWYLFF